MMGNDFISVGTAARLLGLSTSTVKKLCDEGVLDSLHTEGGHRRIPAEAIESYRTRTQNGTTARNLSPTLQNRREAIEGINLEIQERRAKRELKKLDDQDREERQAHVAEGQAHTRAEKAEAKRLRLEETRLKYQQAQERELSEFRRRWLEKAAGELPAWLVPQARKEILDTVREEIAEYVLSDEPIMPDVIGQAIAQILEPIEAELRRRERDRKFADAALASLPYGTTDAEKARATAAIRDALGNLPRDSKDFELRAVAEESIRAIRQAAERRIMFEGVVSRAVRQLPWASSEADKTRLRRECQECLAELPHDTSQGEAEEEIAPLVREACHEIEDRQAQEERDRRKRQLVRDGVGQVFSYLHDLKSEGEITPDELWDSDLRRDLERAAKEGLEDEIAGDETAEEVRELVEEIIDNELG